MAASGFFRKWYALHTRSRFENVVLEGLTKKDIEVFLPKITVRSKRVDRKKLIRVPLFPGYLFVKTSLEPHEHLDVVKTIGVVKIVGNRLGPIPISDNSVESLKIMVQSEQNIFTGTNFKPGDRVIVITGPFAGVTGFFVRYRGQGRVVVIIEALGQYASVDVREDDIEIIRDDLLITA